MVNDIIPTVLVKNEERYIGRVLRALSAVFDVVLLGDTGSTDATREIARAVPRVEVIEFGAVSPQAFTEARRELGRRAASLGATWQFQCDGDELYCAATLRGIVAQGMPPGRQAGFTDLKTLDADEQGGLWEINDGYTRLAMLPATVLWHGDYPFDGPNVFDSPELYHYFGAVPGYRYHGLHLHRLVRSGQDESVMFRSDKRLLFSMQAKQGVVRTVPFDLEAWDAQEVML